MKLLAISGSARLASVNTALLRALGQFVPEGVDYVVFDGVGELPVFSPDREGAATPRSVRRFKTAVAGTDGLLVACPEYVRSIPGGMKNAIDWLVSGEEIIAKPIALVHVSQRGDDMLAALRTVLGTVSANFRDDLFFRLPVSSKTPEEIGALLSRNGDRARAFLAEFATYCASCAHPS